MQAKKQAQPKRLTSEAKPAGKQLRRSGAGVLDIGSSFDYDMAVSSTAAVASMSDLAGVGSGVTLVMWVCGVCGVVQYGKKPVAGEEGSKKGGKGGKAGAAGAAGEGERESAYKFRGPNANQLRKGGKPSHHAFKSKAKHRRRK